MRALLLRSPFLPNGFHEALRAHGWEVTEAAEEDGTWPPSPGVFSLVIASGDAQQCRRVRSAAGCSAHLLVHAVTTDPATISSLLDAGADDVLLSASVEELDTRLAVARRRCAAAAAPQAWRELETIRGAHLEELIESAPEGIAVTDPECRVLRVNGEFTRIFGCTAEEAVGRTIDELVAPEERRDEAEALTDAVLRGERVGLETMRRRRDGSLFHASVLAIPIRVEGRHVGNYGIYRDITQRKLTEAALRESEDRYRNLVELSPDGIAVHAGGRVVFVNRAGVRLVGASSADEVLGRPIFDFIHPEAHGRIRERVESMLRTGAPAPITEERFVRMDGTVAYGELAACPLVFAGKPAIQVVIRDLTERRSAAEALRASEQRYRALFDQSPVGVFQFDRELRITRCNERLLEILHVPREELIGQRLDRTRDPRILPAIRRALTGRAASYEGAYTTTTRGMELWISMNLSPLRSPQGEVVGGIGALENITERKRAQAALARLNDELRRRTREVEAAMLSRNRLYVSMNHELRTPISAIMLYNELLLGGTLGPLREEQAEAVEHAQKAASHLMELVHDVLDLSKIEAGKMELQLVETSLPELLGDLLSTVRPLAARNGVALGIEIGDTPPVVTDPRRVRQILLNLLSNAVKFGRSRPVRLRCHGAGEEITLEVEDQGVGIAADDLPRIFEEFVQVGEARECGTGLGLAISHRLATLLGGRLEVQSAPGVGSRFRLVLPVAASVPARA